MYGAIETFLIHCIVNVPWMNPWMRLLMSHREPLLKAQALPASASMNENGPLLMAQWQKPSDDIISLWNGKVNQSHSETTGASTALSEHVWTTKPYLSSWRALRKKKPVAEIEVKPCSKQVKEAGETALFQSHKIRPAAYPVGMIQIFAPFNFWLRKTGMGWGEWPWNRLEKK